MELLNINRFSFRFKEPEKCDVIDCGSIPFYQVHPVLSFKKLYFLLFFTKHLPNETEVVTALVLASVT